MKTLADTKREIVENEKPRFGKWLNEKLLGIAIDDLGIGKRGRHILVKEIEAKQKQLLSTALDKAWEDFKGGQHRRNKTLLATPHGDYEILSVGSVVVKKTKRKDGYTFDEVITDEAIDELKKKIEEYEVKISGKPKAVIRELMYSGKRERAELFGQYIKHLREAYGKKYGVRIKGKI